MKNHPLQRILALMASALFIANAASAASKTWAVGGGDTNWSSVANWSPVGVPGTGDDVIFLAAGQSSTLVTNNVVDAGFTAKPRTLNFNQTNANYWTLISTTNLIISSTASGISPLFVGTGLDGDASATNLAVISGKALTIINTNASIFVRQAGSTGAGTAPGHRATLNLSGLSNFTANVQNFLVGYESDGLISDRRPVGTVLFARTNTITCTSSGFGFQIGHVVQTAGNPSTNRLGQVNFLNFNSMRIGGAKCTSIALNFNAGLTSPSVTFRNVAGTGRQSTWYLADNATSGSSSQASSVVDFTGGTVDALVDAIYVGRGQTANTAFAAGANAVLTFNAGTIDVNTLEMGYQVAASASAARGLVNVNGTGLLSVNKDIRLARNLGPGTSAIVTNSIAILTISGGTAQVFGNIVDGGGTNIITITNNGTLNMKPAGDLIPGNIGVRVLNIGAGTLTNYATLNVSNLNVLSPASKFTVYPGQTLGVIGAGLVGTLTVNTNLVLTNASVALDLGTPGGANDKLAVLAGLTLSGTNSVLINPLSGFGAGTYPVMTYGPALNGDVTNNLKIGGAMADSRFNLYFDSNTVQTVTLNVSGGPAKSLTWSGDGLGNFWNLHTTANWNAGSGANTEQFYNLDTVAFDDTGSASPAVSLVGALLPAAVTVNGTNNYTFSGAGKISGSSTFAQNSTGTVTLLSTNDFTGITTISSGALQVGNGTTADGGIGSVEIDNNSALIFNSVSSQYVPAVITGSGAITKRGPGVTQLAGVNTFSVAVTNEAGTLLLGSASALGDSTFGTTINSGASLDLGGQNLGVEPVVASGTGVGGAGVIINSGPLAASLQNLTLVGPATFGGPVSWTITPSSGSDGLHANINKITKVGSSGVQLSNPDSSFVSDPGLGDLEIQAGTVTFFGYMGLGDPGTTITIRSNATMEIDNTGDSLTPKLIAMDGGATISSALPNRLFPQYASLSGPITLGGTDVVNVVATDAVILYGEVSGTGPLIKGNPGALIFNASNSFTGDLLIQSGTVALSNNASVTRAPNIVLSGSTLDVSGRTDLTLTLASGQTLKGNGTVIGTVISPAGSTVSPGASIGAISVNGNVTLRGNTVMELSKVASVYSADLVAATGMIDLGGTLTVTYSGDNLQTGDTFTLFTAGTFANAFTTTNLPVIPGVVWTNMTAIDGTLRVLSAPVPSQPTITGATPLPNHTVQLNFTGPSGYGYSVRATTDLTLPVSSWTILGTATFSAGPASYIDLNAPGYPQRFYLISVP